MAASNAAIEVRHRPVTLEWVGRVGIAPLVITLGGGADLAQCFLRCHLGVGLLLDHASEFVARLLPTELSEFLAQLFDRALEINGGLAGFIAVITEQKVAGSHGADGQCKSSRAAHHAKKSRPSTPSQRCRC